ncbi:MAG: M3 family oligoendopeptidase [FCB group bacterium]|nr:M3 family oligoendopeptidase [FCB group bacterium]
MYQLSGFIPHNLDIRSWDDIRPYFDKLLAATPATVEDLEQLILHYSDVISVFDEQFAWAYINMSCHTDNEDYVRKYEIFATKIHPEVSKAANRIDQKIVGDLQYEKLAPERYAQLKRKLSRDLEIFREENVPLDARLSKLSSKYEQIAGGITATIDGEILPIPQASVKLQSSDRAEREKAWKAITASRQSAKSDLDALFSEMVQLRHQVALNAGFDNFRDYQHANLHRFDYSPQDAEIFHDAIEKHVVPLAREVVDKHRRRLGLSRQDYRPWDVSGEPAGQEPLKPFRTGSELLDKTRQIFTTLLPEFGTNLGKMDSAGLFDLDSRKGKAPGGYNYPLSVTGMPFIFMNAAGTQRDVVTLMHEGGHAMHTFLTNDEPLSPYRDSPAEVAETASMSMELMTSKYWDAFYTEADYLRARREHLEGIITFFPWCAVVDAFQHWIYLHPEHTTAERDDAFVRIYKRFDTGLVNWSGYERELRNLWRKQPHIFTVPFYYIEYGIAQLGALQVYRNYKANNEKGLKDYMAGLSLGSSRSIPEVWSQMNIRFDFSGDLILDLMEMIQEELSGLES